MCSCINRRDRTSTAAAPGQRSRVGPLALAVMRMAGIIAASVLVAGCSQSVGGDAERSRPSLSVPPSTAGATQSTSAHASTVPDKPPEADAQIAAVVAWIEAGSAADSAGYHVATRGGDST